MKKLILVVVSCAALLTPAVVSAHEGHLHNAL